MTNFKLIIIIPSISCLLRRVRSGGRTTAARTHREKYGQRVYRLEKGLRFERNLQLIVIDGFLLFLIKIYLLLYKYCVIKRFLGKIYGSKFVGILDI